MTTKTKRFLALLLRVIALGATVAAIVIMVTSHDSATVLNLTFEAKYSNTPAFRYFVIAEAVAGGYSVLALLLSFNSLFSRLVLMMDVVIAMLLSSSISAALAIAHVGKKGNSHAGWLPICGQVPNFCDKVTGALIAGFIASILYLLLILYSLHSALAPLFALKP
ncbi:CASP-like protein 1C3 [Punica granatum]|uniref:CASP-like protein n=2 Tax=Punica granatum TaxID=22663 RepID=A0A218WXP0_PUNGR|nr:CASP-like protein 1C3 [Punica granatum]OWM77464.1 hypothetical protein CDL15_Pgr016861 [Punica granatum]PKI69452.1 hypothetical protein CRG98_010155 [Punica granatum]